MEHLFYITIIYNALESVFWRSHKLCVFEQAGNVYQVFITKIMMH